MAAGLARRNFLVPVPQVESLVVLNATLRQQCQRDLEHHTRGRAGTKGERLLSEDQAAFLPLIASCGQSVGDQRTMEHRHGTASAHRWPSASPRRA